MALKLVFSRVLISSRYASYFMSKYYVELNVQFLKAYLARIDEVNLKGPALRAVLETNPSALAQAAALDAERKLSGKRSLLHGIPVLLKVSS